MEYTGEDIPQVNDSGNRTEHRRGWKFSVLHQYFSNALKLYTQVLGDSFYFISKVDFVFFRGYDLVSEENFLLYEFIYNSP